MARARPPANSPALPAWLPPLPLLALWVATRAYLLAGLPSQAGSGDGVMQLTHGWVEEIRRGDSPYHAEGIAYPPLAMLSFVLPGFWGASLPSYRVTFALMMVAADFAGLLWSWRAERDGRRFTTIGYTAAIPALGPLLILWRYDLIPAVCHLAAATCALRGARRRSWVWLGIGIAFKPYLAAVVPLWLVWELRQGGGGRLRRVSQGAGLAILPSALAALLILPLSGGDFADAYGFQLTRGLEFESTPAVILAEAGRAGSTGVRNEFSRECLCWERTGPAAGTIGGASTALTLAALAGVVLWLWRRPDAERLVAASVAAVIVMLLFYRVFSPQFLVWPLPPLALLAGRARRAGALAALGGAAVLTSLEYPTHFVPVLQYQGVGRALLLLRVAAMAAALVLLLGSERARRPTEAAAPREPSR